jgi:polar amino acid transport system substrate-binding protein
MLRNRTHGLLAMVAVLAIVATACGSDEPEPGPGEGGGMTDEQVCASHPADAGDLLAEICSKGTITVSTDPAYPPQSSLNVETGEYEGFDIDVATEIANRLGVDIAWVEPNWNAIIAGNWQGRWDMSVGSMTVTTERAEVLHFTPAYYFTPAAVAVPTDSDVTALDQLSGQTVATCAGCTYDYYLSGTLDIPGFDFGESPITGPVVKGYDTDSTAIQAVLSGQADAVVSALPTLESAIDKGREIKVVGDPLFYEPLSVAIDKSSELDPTSLVDEVSAIVEEMHTDGTLSELSMKWFGEDLTTSA